MPLIIASMILNKTVMYFAELQVVEKVEDKTIKPVTIYSVVLRRLNHF